MIYLGFPNSALIIASNHLPKQYPQTDARATRVSQIAAVILIDLGTVDIRRVGTSVLAGTRRGVPSKILTVVRVFRATISCAQV